MNFSHRSRLSVWLFLFHVSTWQKPGITFLIFCFSSSKSGGGGGGALAATSRPTLATPREPAGLLCPWDSERWVNSSAPNSRVTLEQVLISEPQVCTAE